MTALSASRERGETERVQSHLLFYRQPAFSPRDLIITRSVERIAHDAHSHTMIHANKAACFDKDVSQRCYCEFSQPYHPLMSYMRHKRVAMLQSSTWKAIVIKTHIVFCLQADTKGVQMQPSTSKNAAVMRRWSGLPTGPALLLHETKWAD